MRIFMILFISPISQLRDELESHTWSQSIRNSQVVGGFPRTTKLYLVMVMSYADIYDFIHIPDISA